jgi:AcrR family transcriptional regulator
MATLASSPPRPPTRERIVAAALPLFARQGFRGTSVGQIEAAAGLSPRSGALYKHFASKRDVLAAALDERSRNLDHVDSLRASLSLADPESELKVMGHLALDELEREHDLIRVVMREGDEFPDLVAGFRDRLVRRGADLAVDWLARACRREGVRGIDVEAVAAVHLAALVGYRMQDVLFGEPTAAVARERFLDAWARGWIAELRGLGLKLNQRTQEATS